LRPHIYRTRDFGRSWQEIVSGMADNAPVNVVREDPVRKGLLFAGTENMVYVSFDAGDHWQELQLNLPHTSMRDLTIHGDDLIVGTHGRSFWILDDITPLRQLDQNVSAAEVNLFAPQEAIRIHWNRNPDTPLPPEEPAGQNPPDGAIIDYFLAQEASGPVRLEILDAAGKPVREYSSADKTQALAEIAPKHPIPMYWVREAQKLSTAAGMHRFVWDVRHTAPKSLSHSYPISAIAHDTPQEPRGAWALPGRYTVKLTIGGKTFTQPLVLKMDPRIRTSRIDLEKQFAMQHAAVAGMNESYEALGEVQSVRAQVKELLAQTMKPELHEKLASLDSKAGLLEGAAVPGFFGTPPAGKQTENLSTLNQHFGQILALADSADVAPTATSESVASELQQALRECQTRWLNLKNQEVNELNRLLRLEKLNPIDFNKKNRAEPSSEADGDDEP
jgi:hypothetical protein